MVLGEAVRSEKMGGPTEGSREGVHPSIWEEVWQPPKELREAPGQPEDEFI